jgi:hypothetical protein
MQPPRTLARLCLFLLLASRAFAEDAKPGDVPTIISVKKIWDAGKHNAFTDLLWFKDQWYCTFREGDAHIGGEGKLRVLTSPDGKTWTSVALLTESGIDLRDPKISETPDGRLMMLAGGSVYEGKKLLSRQPRVSFSSDGGKTWALPQRVLAEGDWLWRLTWHKGRAYGISYREDRATLFSTADGTSYDRVADLKVPDRPNEATVRFTADDKMVILIRREAGDKHGWVGTSAAPYTTWSWADIPHRLGGPNFLILPTGEMWAAGRAYGEKSTNVLARFSLPNHYTPVLTFPSGGDCSYPGMDVRDGVLFMSYYSSHEGKTNIYFAEVKLP